MNSLWGAIVPVLTAATETFTGGGPFGFSWPQRIDADDKRHNSNPTIRGSSILFMMFIFYFGIGINGHIFRRILTRNLSGFFVTYVVDDISIFYKIRPLS
jgi:hypothetical protein